MMVYICQCYLRALDMFDVTRPARGRDVIWNPAFHTGFETRTPCKLDLTIICIIKLSWQLHLMLPLESPSSMETVSLHVALCPLMPSPLPPHSRDSWVCGIISASSKTWALLPGNAPPKHCAISPSNPKSPSHLSCHLPTASGVSRCWKGWKNRGHWVLGENLSQP